MTSAARTAGVSAADGEQLAFAHLVACQRIGALTATVTAQAAEIERLRAALTEVRATARESMHSPAGVSLPVRPKTSDMRAIIETCRAALGQAGGGA